ncbi:MAG: hypothetical protein L0Z50_12510, partial [Verrucomicrobiales bacterium]|nr:hypothetical protein [Verrucomicrobiales bacterium]
KWDRSLIVVIYALAMAWVESAVVFYLRTFVDRLVPYQPNPLPIVGGLGVAEVIREAATIIMLFAVGWLAGQTWRSRLGYALLAFGVWDVAYYLWLFALTDWPTSLADWDILFLIPLPWWGPVWSPVSIAGLMILFGAVIGRHDSPERPLWPGRITTFAAAAGGLVALYVFMADSLGSLARGNSFAQLRELLPQSFNWPLFLVALAFLSAPVLEVLLKLLARRRLSAGHPMNHARWIGHFARNRQERPEPIWCAPVPVLHCDVLKPLVRSLEQFRLGDGGGPASLIAYDAERFRSSSPEMRTIVDAWFKEEAEHSRLLGCAVQRFGGRIILSHWSFTTFCWCRRALGVQFELQVLTLTEIVSTGYYRVLRRHSPDAPLAEMCALILRDEACHVAFQRDRLAASGRTGRGATGPLWRLQFWWLGHAAATMLWINHGPCLKAIGASRSEYFREVRRELRRFIASLRAESRSRRSPDGGCPKLA